MTKVETVMYNRYELVRVGTSELGLEQEIEKVVGFRCPRCSCPNPSIEHGFRGKCPNCGLYFQRFGNALDCSDVEFETSTFERPQ